MNGSSTSLTDSLKAFVPPDAFDAHAHLFRRCDAGPSMLQCTPQVSGDIGWREYCSSVESWLGQRRPTAGLFFTNPARELETDPANQFVLGQLNDQSDSRALLMIRPSDDPATVEATIESDGFAGFKVYHVYADRGDSFVAEIHEFLPEWAWEIAHRRELAIMLHIVRPRALADPANQREIRQLCERYPHARLILAHCARGFCGAHTVEGIESLRGLGNVFFDTSAVCEAASMEAILRVFGPSRLLFGSDFPVSEIMGRCVSIGDGFLWLDRENLDWESSAFAQPAPVGVESLLALRQACQSQRLVDSDVERIFRDNARELLNLNQQRKRERGESLYRRAKQLIPGGTQLLSKRPERFAPDHWPAYYREARGCEVIDLDDRRLIDMSISGIGSCLLGFADPDVTDAVIRRVQLGSMCTLNAAEDVELAELLIELHPWADQVRYCRTGGESMAVAVRIARARTGRDRVAFCGYHGWSDWYLAANLSDDSQEQDGLDGHLIPGLQPNGVPRGLTDTALPFTYNGIDQLRQIIKEHGPQLAAVVMEPTRSVHPDPGFLESVKELCDQCGAVLVFDEITVGWRLALGGSHLRYGVDPDIAVFAKATGSGHPMAAIIGRADVMQAVETSFISSTYWTEGVGPTAALATIRKMQRIDVPAHIERIGQSMRNVWNELGEQFQVPVSVSGHSALLHLGFDHPRSAALGTLMTVRMLDRGFLTGLGFYPSLAHTELHVATYRQAAESVFAELAEAIGKDDILQRLDGPTRQSGFARLTTPE